MLIRPTLPAELPALRELAERTFREAWQHMNDPEPFEQYCREKFTPEHIAVEMARPGSEFYFACIDDRPVAYLKLNIDCLPESAEPMPVPGNAVQIERVYVLQNIQSQGLGAQLLQFSERRACETGASWLWLSVWQKSPRSILFYERHGFSIFGVETFWVGDDPQLDWLMFKAVDAPARSV